MRILFVEDHAVFAEIVIEQFLAGIDVTLVGTLADASAVLEQGRFDAILVDFDLPDGKGSSLVEELREARDPIRIIGVSAREQGNDALLQAGADSVCPKAEFRKIKEYLEPVREEPLRQGTVADASATRRFRQRILDEGLETIFKGQVPTLEEQEAWHRRFEEDPNSVLLLYFEGEEVVGVLSFESFAATEECRHAGAFGLSVLSEHRGKGIGSRLIRTLIDWARAHPQVRRLELEVFSNNAQAKALYERLGFEVEGTKKGAVRIGDRYLDSIVMTKWVDRKPVINLEELDAFTTFEAGPFRQRYADVGERIGAKQLGYNLTVVAPGEKGCPFHNHRVSEEMFHVLRGTGTLRFGEQEYPLKPGDVIACPPGGPSVAHQIINTGEEDLAYLALGTRNSCDVVDYPDSEKRAVHAEGLRQLFSAKASLGYTDGES